jgi:hypothetical protein
VILSPAFSHTVTLNLFQGPSCRKRGAVGQGASRTGRAGFVPTMQSAKWMLKQVQHDEHGNGGVVAPRVEFIR